MSQQQTVDFSLNKLFLRSPASRPALKLGLVLAESSAPRFVHRILDDIVEANFATITCVLRLDAGEHAAGMLPDGLCDSIPGSNLVLGAYCRWLDAPQRREPDPLANVDVGELLHGIPIVDLRGAATSANAELAALDLDVILNFDARSHAETLAPFARHGVWSMRFGELRDATSAPLFNEVFAEGAASHARLVSHRSATGDPVVLSEMTLGATRTLSVSANRFDVCWSAQHFVIHNLFRLHGSGGMVAERSLALPPPAPRAEAPGNLAVARALLPAMRRAMAERGRRDELVHWRIGLRRTTTPLFRADGADAMREFSWLQSPPGRFWADPCLFSHDGQAWMFFEESAHEGQHGVVMCGRIRPDGALDEVRVALSRPYHLSYPQVFEAEGAIWMIPETRRAERLELYRCVQFPDVWTLECALLDLRVIDPTIFQWNSRWWMFVSSAAVSNQSPTTWLFSAPGLTGPWRIHPASPVCSDARWSRGAGAVLRDGPRLLRPSQDCLRMYGYSVTFNEITALDEQRYEERRDRTVEPGFHPGLLGIHTYARAGEWEAIDGQYRVSRAALRASTSAVSANR